MVLIMRFPLKQMLLCCILTAMVPRERIPSLRNLRLRARGFDLSLNGYSRFGAGSDRGLSFAGGEVSSLGFRTKARI